MITVSDDLTFALSNAHFSFVARVSAEGIVEQAYYGAPLSAPLDVASGHQRTSRGLSTHWQGVPNYALNEVPQICPVFGTSDYRYPALHGQGDDGISGFSLTYKSYEIVSGKPACDGLPGARGDGAQTLILTLEDRLQGVEVDLHLSIWADYGVLARHMVVRNLGTKTLTLDHVASSCLDLPPAAYDLIHFTGSWSREFQMERVSLPRARIAIESARGSSSAAHPPYMALIGRNTTEDTGTVFATTLVYSGNHALSVETGEYGDIRVLAGLNPFNFEWQLSPGETFCTPEALHVFTENGMRGMSHLWHDFIRDRISPKRFRHVPRPTYLNSWEAAYFDMTEDKVLDLADRAVAVGVEMLVLDDGWFAGRRDDTSSLGDWRADPARFPSGIAALAAQVKSKGLKFGLWFEPEMVNSDSQLYRDHPDWTLQIPGRKASLGRNQLTLDLSRADVRDYLLNSLDAILSCGDIDYIKWDMNRNMSEVEPRDLPHRYMLGLYELLTRLTEKYPDVLFENCASGGNRFDLGMLSFMAQGWVSDMCDPIGRLEIINGASHFLPLDVMAAYIGPSPNHQNGRLNSIQARFLAGAFCAARGLSLSEAELIENEAELIHWMKFAKATVVDMVGGRFYRLRKTENDVYWQYTTRDESRVYLINFQILANPNEPFQSVRFVGLDPEAVYKLKDSKETYRGDALIRRGFTLPHSSMFQDNPAMRYMPKGDFSAALQIFERQSG